MAKAQNDSPFFSESWRNPGGIYDAEVASEWLYYAGAISKEMFDEGNAFALLASDTMRAKPQMFRRWLIKTERLEEFDRWRAVKRLTE